MKSSDIKDGSIGFFDIGNGAVSSGEIFDGAVGSADIADGSVTSTDVKDDTLTRADIAGGVVPGDADVFLSDPGGTPALPADAAGLSSYQFTMPRNGKVNIQFFAGALGITCAPDPGNVGLYMDGAPIPDTQTVAPSNAGAGAVLLAANDFLQAGAHTVSVAADCPTGAPSEPAVATRPVWAVEPLAR